MKKLYGLPVFDDREHYVVIVGKLESIKVMVKKRVEALREALRTHYPPASRYIIPREREI